MEPPRAGEVPIASFLCRLDRQTRSFTGPIYAEQPQVATCNPGRLTPAAAQKMMDRVNYPTPTARRYEAGFQHPRS